MILPMARRMLAWLLVTPLAAVGVLAAHAAAYARHRARARRGARIPRARTPGGRAPGIARTARARLQERSLRPWSAWWVAPIAPLGFTCQEHLERLAHTGELPWLLTTPTFLVGLALQLPVAVASVLLVRRVTGTLDGRSPLISPLPPSPGGAWLPLSAGRSAPHPPWTRSGGVDARRPLSCRPERLPRVAVMRGRQRRAMRPAAMLFALAASALALAGCGGGSSQADATTETDTGTETVQPTATTTDTTTETTTAATTSSAPKPKMITVVVKQGRPQGGIKRPSVEKGDKVVLVVPDRQWGGRPPARLRHREARDGREARADPVHGEPPGPLRARAPPPGRAARRDQGEALSRRRGLLAHGIGGVQDLPVPTWLFYWGAAIVLVVSFVAARRALAEAAARRARASGARVPAALSRVVLGPVPDRRCRSSRSRSSRSSGPPRSSVTPTRSGTSRRPGST